MIDLLEYLRIFSDLFTNFTFPHWEKNTQNINWQWHTSTKITIIIIVQATQKDQSGPSRTKLDRIYEALFYLLQIYDTTYLFFLHLLLICNILV